MRSYKLPDHDQFAKRMADIAKDFAYEGKNNLKSKLIEQISFENASWLERVREVGRQIALGRSRKFLLKELLLHAIGHELTWRQVWADRMRSFSRALWPQFRRVGAGALAFAFVMVLVLEPWAQTERVDAANFAYLTGLDGEVRLIRGEEELLVGEGEKIKKGDRLLVSVDGNAELRMANSNLFRFAGPAEFVVDDLSAPSFAGSKLALNLVEGDAWFNVVNKVAANGELKVMANDLLVAFNDQGSGHLRVTPEFARIVSVNSNVDIVLSHNQQLIGTKLLPEQMIKVRTNTPFLSYQERLRFVEKVSNDDLGLFEENLLADRQHQRQLERDLRDEIVRKAGLTPEDTLYPLEQFKRKAKLALAFDKEEVKLEIARDKFYEAQKVLNEGNEETAVELLGEYKQEIAEVSLEVNKLSEQDPAKAEELKENLDDELLQQRHSLVALEDDLQLAEARVALESAELISETLVEEDELTEEVIDHVENLVEITEPIADEDTDLTEELEILEERQEELAEETQSEGDLHVTEEVVERLEEVTELEGLQLEKLEVLVEEVVELKDVKEKAGVEPEVDEKEEEVIEEEPKPLDPLELPESPLLDSKDKDFVEPVVDLKPEIEVVQPGVKILTTDQL